MREAVILAAGCGRRLNGAGGGLPKCLAPIGGRPLIERQIEMLRAAGAETIWVVVGYQAERVEAQLNGTCRYIHNPDSASTNSLHSLWLALPRLSGGFTLMNGDVLVHPSALTRLDEISASALAYDSTSGQDPEHMKVSIEGGQLQEMSKTLPPERVCGENVGLLRFDDRAAEGLFREAEALLHAGASDAWAPAAVSRLASVEPIHCVDIAPLPWIEIDFAADLQRAESEIWPAISQVAP